MNILVDTQVLLWAQTDSKNLSRVALEILTDDTHLKWVASVSLFEIAIKHKIGKLPLSGLSPADFFAQLKTDGYRLLSLATEHIIAYEQIPFFEDPRDYGPSPRFDRLILATALHRNWPVMSADRKFGWYKDQVDVIW